MARNVRQSQLVALIGLIYGAAVEPLTWPDFLERLSHATRSASAWLAVHDTGSHRGRALWYHDPAPELVEEYARWAPLNPIMLAAEPVLRAGFVGNSEAVVSDHELLRSEYFCSYMRRLGVLHSLGACVARERTLSAMLLVNRALGDPSHSEADLDLVRTLMPHLQQAVKIQQRLGHVDLERSAAAAALDRIAAGVLVLDGEGKVLFFNRSAGTIVDQSDGLALVRGRVTAARSSEAAALQRLVRNACTTEPGAGVQPGGAMGVSRPSGRRPFSVLVAPLRLRQFALAARLPAAVVFVSDPDRAAQGVGDVLRQLYGLTPAEASVATLLVSGRRVGEICEQQGVTLNTVRTHVRRLLEKTGARTQSDLVRVLVGGPAGLHLTDA